MSLALHTTIAEGCPVEPRQKMSRTPDLKETSTLKVTLRVQGYETSSIWVSILTAERFEYVEAGGITEYQHICSNSFRRGKYELIHREARYKYHW